MSINRLMGQIRKMRNPTVAGLDPRVEYLPEEMLNRHIAEYGETLTAAANAFYEFNCGLIDGLCDIVPAVKLQSACYELLGAEGVEVFRKTADYAKKNGMYVIGDLKRGDIGSTAEAYSAAYLGRVKIGNTEIAPFDFDCMTVNPYLGSDGIQPFLTDCKKYEKGIFVLAKTSNKSSFEIQDMISGDRLVYRVVAELIERWGKGTAGEYGFREVGAVVGATYPSQLKELRTLMPDVFFLVPGYGAQGGQASDIEYAFTRMGHGAVINSSRAIMCAWQKSDKNYVDAAREEAITMRDEIKKYVTIA